MHYQSTAKMNISNFFATIAMLLLIDVTPVSVGEGSLRGLIAAKTQGRSNNNNKSYHEVGRILDEAEEEIEGKIVKEIEEEVEEEIEEEIKEKIEEQIEEKIDEEIEEEKKQKEKKEKEEYVPVVTEDCADSDGLIVVAENQSLNCRQIRKSKLCDREMEKGVFLYESCEKSCGICLELIPTTDAPTADLVEMVLTDMPTDEGYKSYAPSYQPTSVFTDEPTEAPSHYPTDAPTDNILETLFDGLDDDILLSMLGENN